MSSVCLSRTSSSTIGIASAISTVATTTTPTSPIENSATATPIRSWVLSTAGLLASDAEHRDGGDDRGDEEHRGELEQQPVLGQERDRERGDAERHVAELAHRR